jgi:hypothetical protein
MEECLAKALSKYEKKQNSKKRKNKKEVKWKRISMN